MCVRVNLGGFNGIEPGLEEALMTRSTKFGKLPPMAFFFRVNAKTGDTCLGQKVGKSNAVMFDPGDNKVCSFKNNFAKESIREKAPVIPVNVSLSVLGLAKMYQITPLQK
jgi:hypothetical protein